MGFRITGTATLSSGAAASKVLVFNWTTGVAVTLTTPASDGSWVVAGLSPSVSYGVVYLGPTGYKPKVDGPIAAVADGFLASAWNPSDKDSGCTLSGSNLIASFGNAGMLRTTSSKSAGKWQVEFTINGGTSNCVVGVATGAHTLSQYLGQSAEGWGAYGGGNVAHSGSFSGGSSRYSNTNIVSAAIDMDAHTLQFYLAGVATGALVTGLPSTVFVAAGAGAGGTSVTLNAGDTAMAYPLSGFNQGWSV